MCIVQCNQFSTVLSKVNCLNEKVGYFNTPVYNNCVLNQTQEDFLTCKLPDGFTLSPWSFGFNILSCGPQYTNFHTDWEDPTDAFITLHGTGKKIRIFLPPGEFAALYERPTENPENLLTHLKDIKQKRSYCVQLPGDTVYLPFGQFQSSSNNCGKFNCPVQLISNNFEAPENEYSAWSIIIVLVPMIVLMGIFINLLRGRWRRLN